VDVPVILTLDHADSRRLQWTPEIGCERASDPERVLHVNALEDGKAICLDFGKVQSAAKSLELLLPVVLQHAETQDVLFVGYANEVALRETLATRRAVLWSTSRNELWRKGATSGDWLDVVDVRVNCEQNSLLYVVRPRTGGVCHTRDSAGRARDTCYYRALTPGGEELVFRDA
jgi:phosphoribosyl-AMP cyclohydrolase